MKRVSSRPSSLVPFVAALAALTSVGCSAGDDGDGDDEIQSFNPLGAAGATSTGAGGQVSTPVGSAGTGGTGVASGGSNEGVGGSLSLGSGGSGSGSGVGSGTGGSGNPSASGGTGAGVGGSGPAGSAGTGAGGSVAAGGSGGTGGEAAGPGRVGAELCPPGPFGNPLGGGVTVGAPVASVNGAGFLIFEGPVWTGTELFFSEIGNGNVSQINRFTPNGAGFERGVFTNTGSNGMAIDENGDLLLAAHDVGGISSVDLPGGAITRGAQQRNGARFNSPNDLVLRGDGNIYFTDPDFQSPSGRIQGGTNVYRIAPDGAITVVDDTMDNPNGVTLSPDGNTLYASANGFLRQYSLDAAGAPTPLGDLATNFGQPDGMAMDCAGNIYAVQNGAQTITVFSPEGDVLGRIGPDGFAGQGVTNAAFGGQNRTTLFITTFTGNGQGGLFAVELGVPGLPY
jgi:gluconolactonase